MADFTFNINALDDAGKELSWPISGAWVEARLAGADLHPPPEAEPGRLTVHAQKHGHDLLVRGHVSLDLLSPCVRCLEPAPFSVSSELVGLLRVGSRGAELVDGAQDEYLDPGLLVGDEVHLDEWVREHIVVETPMRHLCGDDCNGLEVPAHIRPPEDFGGAHEGVDPRLLPLLKLKDKVLPNKE